MLPDVSGAGSFLENYDDAVTVFSIARECMSGGSFDLGAMRFSLAKPGSVPGIARFRGASTFSIWIWF